MERTYKKLVRDKIPEIIEQNGETPVFRTLNEADYKRKLEEKLYEECQEVIESDGENRIEELADMIEVISALAEIEQKSLNDVLIASERKRLERGAFTKRVFLETVLK